MLKLINQQQKSQIKRLKNEIYDLENPSRNYPISSGVNVPRILEESNEALKRFSAKLKKENVKNAKQKQSKG